MVSSLYENSHVQKERAQTTKSVPFPSVIFNCHSFNLIRCAGGDIGGGGGGGGNHFLCLNIRRWKIKSCTFCAFAECESTHTHLCIQHFSPQDIFLVTYPDIEQVLSCDLIDDNTCIELNWVTACM